MVENELQGDKDDFRGMIRTNSDESSPGEDTKAQAFDARSALLNNGYDAEELFKLSAEETVLLAETEELM